MNKQELYDRSPVWVQNMMCSLQGKKIIKERFNDDFFRNLEELSLSQYWPIEKIRQYKEEQTRKMLEYAYKECPFYKTFFDEHHVHPSDFMQLSDIEKFPVLTKELVRENYKGMVAKSFPKQDLVATHTSGSSGKALDFYHTKEFVPYQWAIWWRFRQRMGVDFGMKHLNCTGKLVVPINKMKPPYWRVNKPMNQWLVNMQHISIDKIEPIVDMINREGFVYFSGYPSIIYAIACCIKEKNLKITAPPKFIFSGAEKMYENQKAIIEEVFPGVKCTDHYGMSEGVCNASKCQNDVYHEDYEFGLLECENKHWLSDTEYEGEILGTTFKNIGMPLIRYKIGDTAVWDNRPCDCGLHGDVIKDIQGRSEDFVVTPEGLRIQRFDYLFKDTRDIKECQVVQRELGSVVFRIVKRDNYTIETEKGIVDGVRKIISPTIKCEFEYVNEIERTKAGKFKAVVSEIKGKTR